MIHFNIHANTYTVTPFTQPLQLSGDLNGEHANVDAGTVSNMNVKTTQAVSWNGAYHDFLANTSPFPS